MENSSLPIVRNLDNVFLIDWLTVTFHGVEVFELVDALGLSHMPWQVTMKFINGYPLDCNFGHIHIRYGADCPQFYYDPKKARYDMGISLDMSGQGCREFETWSNKSWFDFFDYISCCSNCLNLRAFVTRLDLAYDDHSGLLNIYRMRRDIEDRNYLSKAKKAMIIWSDDQQNDVQGLTLEVGSKSSPVLIRIYNKAAERGYGTEKHWIRIELQLRKDRAHEAMKLLFQRESVGMVASGIIRNYLTFVTPTSDTNRARWPIAEYWQRVLEGMEKLRVWQAPGEEYNFSKTENWLISQYGQAIQAFYLIHGNSLDSLLTRSCEAHQKIAPKYQAAVEKEMLRRKLRQEEIDSFRRQCGFAAPDQLGSYAQTDFAMLLAADPECPFGGSYA